MRRLGLALAALGLVAIVGSFPAERAYDGRAQLVQRVQRDSGAELFGDAGTPIGSPQRLIIDDPKAFVEGTGEGGARLVDEAYLQKNGIYPLQMKTVNFIASNVRLGGFAGLLLGLAAVVVARKRRLSPATA